MKKTTLETSLRYRINVSQTSTGKKGFDCTVEMEGSNQEDILFRSDALVAELERRYPPEEQKKPIEKPTPKPKDDAVYTPEPGNATTGKPQS